MTPRPETLRALHQQRPLVLPNVWDAATARVFADAGWPALATSSGAVARALGYEDHEGAPADEMLAAAARIAGAVDVPVTADAEAGYGLEPTELVGRLLEAGVAGCNLEDTDHTAGAQRSATEQADRLAAVVAVAGGELVVNARVDTYVTGDGDHDDAIERARAYLGAGVDCTYPIGYLDEGAVATLVEGIGGPVNVLFHDKSPGIARLGELGVTRVTFGSGLFRRAQEAVSQLAEELPRG